jgi:prevent-host-death family protein
MTIIDTTQARKEFSSVVKAANKGERFLLERHGKKVAAVVSVSDLAVLRAIEDRLDREAADAALRDVEANGAIPWEELKAKLGL